jgi:hypothetical protein
MIPDTLTGLRRSIPWLLLVIAMPAPARPQSVGALGVIESAVSSAQQAPGITTATGITPISSEERIAWIVEGVVGPRSLVAVGSFSAGLQTAIDLPQEWGRTWSGFGKRYLEREADVAISNSLEAGIGAIWSEDPRYPRSNRQGIWPRARYAIKAVVLAPRADGRLAIAWGRFAGNVFNNIIENAWLPPSLTTPGQTSLRSVDGFLGRLAGNLWEEFWPDVRAKLRKK